jgi:hypothetical protein
MAVALARQKNDGDKNCNDGFHDLPLFHMTICAASACLLEHLAPNKRAGGSRRSDDEQGWRYDDDSSKHRELEQPGLHIDQPWRNSINRRHSANVNAMREIGDRQRFPHQIAIGSKVACRVMSPTKTPGGVGKNRTANPIFWEHQ